MININLLPEKRPAKAKAKAAGAAAPRAGGAPGKGGALGGLITAVVVIICLGGLAYYGHMIYSLRVAASDKFEKARDERAKLQDEAKKLEKSVAGLSLLSSILDNELKALQALSPDDRVIWAEKLYQLAALTPPDIYYLSLNVTESAAESLTEDCQKEIQKWEEGGRQGPKPPEVKKTITTQMLEISGIIYAKDASDRPKMLNSLYKIMKEFSAARVQKPGEQPPADAEKMKFSRGFAGRIDYGTYMRDKIYDVEITKFSFTIPAISREG